MIILSQAFLASPGVNELDTPIFGWLNQAPAITATSSAAGFPASNLLNPSTALKWQATSAVQQYLTVSTVGLDELDYVAVAVHNFGTGQMTLSVEVLDTSTSPDTWSEVVEEHIVAADDPIIFRFEPQICEGVRLRIQASPTSVVPFAAVMHVGKLLVMPRSTHTDYAPLTLNIQSNVMTGKSETGNFLGRIVLSEQRGSPISFNRLDPLWYRDAMQPMVAALVSDPFFFAWSPLTYPAETGYCWLTADPQPTTHFDTGTMGLSLNMNGVAVG